MLRIVIASKFKRDLRRAVRRGKDRQKLEDIAETLANRHPLDPSYRDPMLTGDYVNHRECHIESDWLLIYQVDAAAEVLHLVRTSTHGDLFD